MKKALRLWYYRNWKQLSVDEAKELGLKFYCDIYGDLPIHVGSIWIDDKKRTYIVTK